MSLLVMASVLVASPRASAQNAEPGSEAAGTGAAAVASPPARPQAAAGPAANVDASPATMQGQQSEGPTATLTGDWGGLRTRLRDAGVDLTGSYTGEVASNIDGGGRTSTTYAGQAVVGATIDAGKVLGLQGGTFQASITDRHGAPLQVGLLEEPQEIYGRGNIVRLTELWYQQQLAGGGITLKFGRMPEGDFDSFPCNFMNLSLCGAPGGNIVGNYWLNWPISQWAGWGRVKVGDVDFMAGVYETNPKDLDLAFAPGWFSGAQGVSAHAEVGWAPKLGQEGLQGRYQLGVWYDTAGGNDVLEGADGRPFGETGLPPLHRSDRTGFYVQALQQITGSGVVDPATGWHGVRGLTFFFNFIQADRETSVLDNQMSVGFLYAAPFASRPGDHIGIGLGRTDYNSRAARALALENPSNPTPRAEYATELYYSFLVTPWLALRPDIQYIIDPGGLVHAPSVVVIGARTALTF